MRISRNMPSEAPPRGRAPALSHPLYVRTNKLSYIRPISTRMITMIRITPSPPPGLISPTRAVAPVGKGANQKKNRGQQSIVLSMQRRPAYLFCQKT